MSLINVEKIDIHGGSVRCYIKNAKDIKPNKKVVNILNQESYRQIQLHTTIISSIDKFTLTNRLLNH